MLRIYKRQMFSFWTTFMLLFNLLFVCLCICVFVFFLTKCWCMQQDPGGLYAHIPILGERHKYPAMKRSHLETSFFNACSPFVPILISNKNSNFIFFFIFLWKQNPAHSRQERRKRLSKEKEAQRRQERSRQSQNLFLLQVVDHWADQRTAQIHKYFVPTVRMY